MEFFSKEEANSRPALYLVTVVGSAGALAPLNDLLANLPRSFEAAVAIGMHASAESRLAEVLQFEAKLPVFWGASGMSLRAGCAYVPPGGSHIVINPNGSLTVPRLPHVRHFRPSASWLLESAAAAYQHRHLAIVLSGMLTDGASRLPLIKRAGGLVLVQEPTECPWPDMPKAALATGCADRVLSAREMPGALQAWLGERNMVRDRPAWERPFAVSANA